MYQNEQQHPGWRVLNDQWDVMIPKIFTHNTNFLKEYGAYTTGDSIIDEQLEYEEVRTVRTIMQLAELNERGARIILVRPTDSVIMFNLISEYARVWSREVESQGLITSIEDYMASEDYQTIEADMQKLLAFADQIQPHATRQLPMAMRSDSPMGRFRLMKERLSGRAPQEPIPKAPLPAEARTLLTDSGSARRIRGRSW